MRFTERLRRLFGIQEITLEADAAEERLNLRCPWCRQWHPVHDEHLMQVWPPVESGRYLITCSNCGGGAVWDYALAPVPLLFSTPQAPTPMKPQISEAQNHDKP